MNGKLLITLSTVAGLHLVVGGLMLMSGGCESTESEPMPPGAFVPSEPQNEPAIGETEIAGTTTLDNYGIVSTPATSTNTEGNTLVLDNNTVTTAPVEVKNEPEAKLIQYKVQPGDSLWKIARRHGVTVNELAAYNNIPANKAIRANQTLLIPPGGHAVKAAAQTPAKKSAVKNTESKKSTKSTSSRKAEPIPEGGVYTVKSGDSFHKIAHKFGIKAADLASFNNMDLNKTLQIGQKLKVPHPGAGVTAADKPLQAKPVSHSKAAGTDAKIADKSADTVKATGTAGSDDALLESIDAPIDAPADNELKPADPTAVPAPMVPPAATTTDAQPAADASVAAPDMVKDTVKDIESAKDADSYIYTLNKDTTVQELINEFQPLNIDELKRLNPTLPANGLIKKGTQVKLPLI